MRYTSIFQARATSPCCYFFRTFSFSRHPSRSPCAKGVSPWSSPRQSYLSITSLIIRPYASAFFASARGYARDVLGMR